MIEDKSFTGTSEPRAQHRFDERALAAWMAREIPGYAGPFVVEQFKGGQSNPTYKLTTRTHNYVLRRKPPGALLRGAHAIEREVRVLRALEPTGVPVAHVHASCADETVIGTAFYVMDHVDGRIFWDGTFPNVERELRPQYFDAMNRTLAILHAVDLTESGLTDFGRPGNYFQRQIDRWASQYRGDVESAGRDPHMDLLIEWLPTNVPASEEASLVHGDFRVDNLIFHPTEPKVVAVLDWELSTVGHPLADFAYHLMMYRMPPLLIAGLEGSDLAALNIPSERDYVAAYCRYSGRDSIPAIDFYVAFNFFRVAAIVHGIKGRLARGTAASPRAAVMASHLPELARRGWLQAQRSDGHLASDAARMLSGAWPPAGKASAWSLWSDIQ